MEPTPAQYALDAKMDIKKKQHPLTALVDPPLECGKKQENNIVNFSKAHKLCNHIHTPYHTTTINNINTPPIQQFSIADTGSSGHYINPSTYCINKHKTSTGPTITLPDGKMLHPTHSSHLAFPST